MNENKIIHGNIKPSNILLTFDKNNVNKVCFKISDYGLSKLYEENNIDKSRIIDSSQLISPECLKGEKIDDKSDIWSLGILIYYLLFQKYPYNGTEYEIMKQIESNKQLNIINDELLDDLLKKMLEPNVNKRINWEEYFIHPFFNNNNVTNNLPSFKTICSKHSKNYYGYFSNCGCNICDICELCVDNSDNMIACY